MWHLAQAKNGLNFHANTTIIGSTVQSTSTDTGALVVSGGVGIAGNLYVNGSITPSLIATHITDTTDAVSSNTGALIVDGGVGITKSMNVGGKIVGEHILPTTIPASPVAGSCYYDTATFTLYAYDGTGWKSVELS